MIASSPLTPRGRTLMMVGHNPGIHQYAVHMARQAGAAEGEVGVLYERFPTGSVAVFGIGEGGRPRFERLLLVKQLRKAAG